MQTNYLKSSIAIATLLLLAACGGGGGSGVTTTAPVVSNPGDNQPVVPTVPPSTIDPTIPPAAYSSASEEAAAFTLLNAERTRCGFGAVAQSTALDTAAKGHADYLLSTNSVGHFQNPTFPGFTGNTALDRAAAAGYGAQAITDENTAAFGSSDITGQGVFSVRSLLSAPYHLAGLTAGYRDIGISIRSSDQLGTTGTFGPRTVQQFDVAYTTAAGAQLPSGADVLTFPCAGTTDTFFEVVNESPNPIPGRDLMVNPIGQPVLVMVREGQTLNVTSATMTETVAGTPVSLRPVMTHAVDPNLELQAHQALVIPDVALKPSTQYTVAVAGTNNGNAFAKTFAFTTGTGTAR